MDVRAQFGLALQRLRRDRDLSQEDISGVTEIDRAYVGRLERGEANPTLLMLARIAGALDVSLSELLRTVKITALPAGPQTPNQRRREARRR